MLRIFLLCLSFCFAGVATAQTLNLSQNAPIICRVDTPAEKWLPSRNDIAALELALPTYLAEHARMKEKMPAPKVEYARQYSGVVRNGRKYIYGRYYPASASPPSFAKAGDCWQTDDGGSKHWSVVFDQKSGKIVSHVVNGIS